MRRGEKGIQILAPIIGHRRNKDAAEQEQDTKPASVLIGFRAVYVFDRLKALNFRSLSTTSPAKWASIVIG